MKALATFLRRCFSKEVKTHIFQNAQVTFNKMVHDKKHYFLEQFSIPFHMVWSVLLRVLAQHTLSQEKMSSGKSVSTF